ncbi:ankyrin-3-like [Ornithodoros turicata]|uniref:ankyrin-3-like n=1 Tax=Ornithodoros turicata TaxID=34597 RepID=UPI003139F985
MMAQIESGEITKSHDYFSLLKIADVSAGRSIYTVHIYKMFVEYKHLVHRNEKVKENIALSSVRGEYDAAQSSVNTSHCVLAMKCIFPEVVLKTLLNEDELEQLDPKESFIKRVADNSLKEGFVNRINDGGIPEFVHKTFAEFFAAQYLLEKAKIRRKPSFWKKVVGLYGEENYEGVMLLLDGLASASYPLHSAVINNDASYFEQRDIQTEDMRVVDELRRTPLHVAALHADKTTLEKLPMDDELIVDDLFKMSPFQYVELFSPWDAEWMAKRMECLRDAFNTEYTLTNILMTLSWDHALRIEERLNVLYTRCSEEAVKQSSENLRSCETFEQKRHFLERAIFTAVIYDLRGILDVYLSYVAPRESIGVLDKDTRDQLESRKKRSLKSSAESSLIGNLDGLTDVRNRTIPFYGKSEAVCKMLLPYCDIGIFYEDGNTMLHISAEEGNLETTKFYLAHLPATNRNMYFQTPLYLSRDAEIVKLLLPHYTSVNDLHHKQCALMDICAKRDDLQAMKLLILRTRIYDAHFIRLNTTLHVASMNDSLHAVMFLLHHTSAHMLNYEGKTCLDFAWTVSWKYRLSSAQKAVMRCLIPHSLVNSPETFGSSPLYVSEGGRKALQTLWPYLRHTDPGHADRISSNSVSVRTRIKDFQEEIWCLKLLVLRLDVIAGDPYSRRLLQDMAKSKLREIKEINYINYMKLLLPHLNLRMHDYVECRVKNDDSVTLYRGWSDMNNTDDPHIDDVVTEMVEDDGNTKLLTGTREGNVEPVEVHLSPSSVCFTDEKENTVLHLSAWNGHTYVVKRLIPFYTSVDVMNMDRKTPMHVCASNGHLDVVKLLLPRSRVSSCDKYGRTPFHMACESGDVDIVNFLLPHSFANMRDNTGGTCLFLFARNGTMNVLRCLIPHSLMNCPNFIGDSPTRICAENYMREELVTLLPYCCDYDAASLLTSPPLLSFCKNDMSTATTPFLKLMVLQSNVSAVDVCFRETLDEVGDHFPRLEETKKSLIRNYISLLLPHTNVSADKWTMKSRKY